MTLSNNAAASETNEDLYRAGALSAAGNVTVDVSGIITISDNSASVNSLSAGAVYAGGGDGSLNGASISITGNSAGSGDADAPGSFSGGAIRSDAGAIYLTSTEGDIVISSNTADENGGALYASSGVEIVSAADIEITENTALTAAGGAIYSEGDVTFTPGEEGKVTISSNTAGGNGGAIYSYETVYMSGGTYEVSDNTAGSYGGAIYATNVDISADAGNITFSGNTHDGGVANDVELDGGTAVLSAANGYALEMQGGITCAADIIITTDENSTVRLGGSSSTESLTIENGRVYGVYDADGNQAVINVSSSVTLDNACLQDIALVDEYGEASLTSLASTYVYNDAVAMLFDTLEDGGVSCTSSAPLLNGFATIDGELAVGMTLDFLQSLVADAGGEAVTLSLTLVLDSTLLAEEGTFTFGLDEATLALLDSSTLESYGFYDAEGNLLDAASVTLTEAGNVVFSIAGLTNVVPEPATATLGLLALAGLAMRRRRRK